jgi:threonine dehydrogenase-like Zn-dependent dehydrogenase
MQGVILPGQEPGYGQVLVKMKASGLCGSDLRAGVSGRDRVLVVGLGAVMLAASSGAEVIGVDLIPERLELGEMAGAAHVLAGR